MNPIWADQAIVQRFAGSLLHFLWQGAALGALTAIGLRLLSRRSAEVRYAASIAGLVMMVAAPTLTFVFYAETGAIALKLLQWTGRMLTGSGALYPLAPAEPAWTQWIVAAWSAGVSISTGRLVVAWHLSGRLVRMSSIAVPESIDRMFRQIKKLLSLDRLSRPIRLLVSAHVDSPVVIGWIRPTVLLPISAITGLSEEQLLAILAHELAHIRRHDFLVNGLQRCVESVLFYHPAVWWLSARIRAERENCCDDLAVKLCGDRRLYVQALVELERTRSTVSVMAVAATGGSLRERVQRILGIKTGGADWQAAAATLAFIAVWMIAGLWQSNTLQAETVFPARPQAPAAATPLSGSSPVASVLNAFAAIATAQPVSTEPSQFNTPAPGLVDMGVIQGVITQLGTREPIEDVQITIAGNVDNPKAFGALMTSLAPYGVQRNPNANRTEEGLIQGLNNAALNHGLPLLDPDYLDALKTFRVATAQHSATSDSTGRFTIKDLPPGQYTIRAEREAYFPATPRGVSQPIASAAVTVSKGTAANVSMTMAAGATVGGRVRDAFNLPLANARVEAFSVVYQGGFPVLQIAAADTSDDRGEFRLFWLPAGQYYIAASAEPATRTYYPGTTDITQTSPVVVRAGDELEGLNFPVKSSRPIRISGTVTSGLPGNGGHEAVIMLMLRDDTVPDNTGERVAARTVLSPTSGNFEIAGVPPGSYDIYARIPDSNPDRLLNGNGMTFGRASVDVNGEDVSGIRILISPTVAIRGSVISDTGPNAWANARFSVQVEGSAAKIPFFQTGVANRKVAAGVDGSFILPAIPQGHYRVIVDGLPSGVYVSDVRQRAVSVFDAGFDVGAEPPDSIQVVLSSNAGTIQGIVDDGLGKPVSGATAILIPAKSRRQNWVLYRTATSDTNGRFTIHGAAPGDYKVVAWESVSSGAYYNPRFIEMYEARGQSVHVSSSATVTTRVAANTDGSK